MAERGTLVPIYVATAVFTFNGIFIAFGRKIAPSPAQDAVAKNHPRRFSLRGGPNSEGCEGRRSLDYSALSGLDRCFSRLRVRRRVFQHFSAVWAGCLGLQRGGHRFYFARPGRAMSFGFWIFSRLTFWHFRPIFIPLTLFSGLVVNLVFVSSVRLWAFASDLRPRGSFKRLCTGAPSFTARPELPIETAASRYP